MSQEDQNNKTKLNSTARQRQRAQVRRQQELNNKYKHQTTTNADNNINQSTSVKHPRVTKQRDTDRNSIDRAISEAKNEKQSQKNKNGKKLQKRSEQSKIKKGKFNFKKTKDGKKEKTKKPINPKKIFGLTFTGSLKQDWNAFSKGQRVWFIALALILFCLVSGILFCLFELITTPKLDMDKLIMTEGTKILDKNGKYYQSLETDEYRELVTIDKVPEFVRNAFVDIEDQRFYSHNGIDFKGLTRAGLSMLTSGTLDGPGGSTITQQLIKQTHLNSEKTLNRKFHEIVLALQLERKLSKDQILEAYLNKINFSQAWGIQAAAKTFFAKGVDQLSIAQATILASMPRSPEYYEPLCWDENGYLIRETDGRCKLNPETQTRAIDILDKMKELGHLTDKEYETAAAQVKNNDIGLTYNPQLTKYSYFTDELYNSVKADLAKKLKFSEEEAENYLCYGGLTILSTVDPEVQSAMETAAANDDNFPGQSYTAAEASAAKSADTGTEVNYIPQVGMTCIDNKTGAVVGIVGGRGSKGNLTMNRATQHFQPGSSTKPLTAYGPGIDSGAIGLGTVFTDTSISVGGWRPENDDGGYSGNMTVRNGLRLSKNIIAVQAVMKTGIDVCKDYAKKVGLQVAETDDVAALALGGYTDGQTTLDMASAFSCFPNKGVHKSYSFYTKVLDEKGKTILEKKTKETQVYSEQTAYLITDVLKQVVQGGTTTLYCDQPVAGKTGTTDERRHAWFCGYSPYYSMAVWYGYDENIVETSAGTFELNIDLYGGSKPGPALMFQEVMNAICANKEIGSFPDRPGGISTVSIDTMSGALATALSKESGHIASDMFIDGTAPTKSDTSHSKVKICNDTGLLANSYCPNVTEKIFWKGTNLFPDGVSGSIKAEEAPKDTCKVHSAEWQRQQEEKKRQEEERKRQEEEKKRQEEEEKKRQEEEEKKRQEEEEKKNAN